jgi:SAM-dependent methyltransferase
MNPFDLESRLHWMDEQLAQADVEDAWIVDIGAGLGHFSILIKKRKGKAIPLDIAAGLVKTLREQFSTAIRADALVLPLGDGKVDHVVSSECIEHTRDPLQAVREMLRVLRPGGRLFLTTPNRKWYWLLRLATALGIRRFRGTENWVDISDIRELLQRDCRILVEEGLYLFPFQISPLRPFLKWSNRRCQGVRRFMINQCWVAEKLTGEPVDNGRLTTSGKCPS